MSFIQSISIFSHIFMQNPSLSHGVDNTQGSKKFKKKKFAINLEAKLPKTYQKEKKMLEKMKKQIAGKKIKKI